MPSAASVMNAIMVRTTRHRLTTPLHCITKDKDAEQRKVRHGCECVVRSSSVPGRAVGAGETCRKKINDLISMRIAKVMKMRGNMHGASGSLCVNFQKEIR